MAVKKRKANRKENNSNKSYFSLSSEKKKRIVGIFFILFSIFLLLSILSYDRRDNYFASNVNLFDSIFNPQKGLHNWMGSVGSYLSYILINFTIGYFSFVFPVILFLWGLSLFRKIPFKTKIHSQIFFYYLVLLLQLSLEC